MSLQLNIVLLQTSSEIILKINTINPNDISVDKYNIRNISNIETDEIIFDIKSSGVFENNCIYFKNKINLRIEYVRVKVINTEIESDFDLYVQSIPRDLRISLNLIEEILEAP